MFGSNVLYGHFQYIFISWIHVTDEKVSSHHTAQVMRLNGFKYKMLGGVNHHIITSNKLEFVS